MMRLFILKWLSLALLLIALPAHATRTELTPLPADEAFAFSVKFKDSKQLAVHWNIAQDYYLYVKSVRLDFTPDVVTTIHWPKGIKQKNKILGTFLAYTGEVTIPVTLPATLTDTVLSVSYQGCSGAGFCYPPITKHFTVDVSAQRLTPTRLESVQFPLWKSMKDLLTDQEGVRAMLLAQPPLSMLVIFLFLGLLLAFTPCVLPMVPILTSIIIGQKHQLGTRKAFLLSMTYVFGMACTYAGAGLAAASLGNSLQVWLQKPLTISIVSGLFILLALSLFGMYELRFSRRWHNKIAAWSDRHQGGTYFGVFCMGILATLVVSPCVTAPLMGVLIYISQTGDLIFGATALFMLGMGMGIPLLLIGMSAGRWVPKSGAWMNAVKEFFGFFMVAMAIWLLARILPLSLTYFLFSLLLLTFSLYVAFYLPRLIKFRKTNRAVGGLLGVLALVLLVNSAQFVFYTEATHHNALFDLVQTELELKQQLAKAKTQHQPVLLDFYADWCESCIQMDKEVFENEKVRAALSKFVLLRVDLSANTAADQAILKQYKVIAPPTVLLFDTKGREVERYRIVGEMSSEEFVLRLQSFKTASCANEDKSLC